MRYVTGFLMKWLMVAVVLLIVFSGIYAAPIGPVLLMSVIFALFTYLIGDVVLLRSMRNITETILDLVLAFLGIWLLSSLLVPQGVPIIAASIISAVVIAVGEWFFHIYMKRRVLHQAEGF